MGGAGYSGEPHVFVSADTRQKALSVKPDKVLNLDHLYFDIVSDLDLRISDFAILGISTFVENPLQITYFYAKQTQFPKKSNERKSI